MENRNNQNTVDRFYLKALPR